MAYAGATSPAHTGVAVTPTSPIPAGQPGGPLAGKPAPQNGLAAFAGSPLGQVWGQANQMYGPSQPAGYPQAFQGALNAARGSIASMLHTSLSDIANSQAKAGEALGQYAPQVNAAWQEGQGQIANADATARGALTKYGMDPGLSQANLAPERIAMQSTHRGDLADQSLLATGIQQEGAHDNAMAHLAANDRMGQVDQLQAQLQNQAAMAAQAQQYQQQNNLQQFGLGLLNNAQQLQNQKSLLSAQTATNTAQSSAYPGMTQGQITQAMTSPQYARMSTLIQGTKLGTPEAANLAGDLLQETNANPALQAILTKKFGSFFSAAVMPPQQVLTAPTPNKLATTVNQRPNPLGGLNSWINPAGWFGG